MNRSFRAFLFAAGLAAGSLVAGGAAEAGPCDPGKPAGELSLEEAQKVYECLRDSLYAGYNKAEKPEPWAGYAKAYREWTPVSALPGNPGFHGGRFLLTYVNEVGAEEYLKYLEERGPMPAGTVIAKESFAVTDKGEAKPGPLFFMVKAEPGGAPETADWLYALVTPGGEQMKLDTKKACAECHTGNFGERDGLGYPVEEARIRR